MRNHRQRQEGQLKERLGGVPTRDQLVQAYPNAPDFVRRKLEIDPDRVFRSVFWDTYLEGLA